jgi:hypothetical protein
MMNSGTDANHLEAARTLNSSADVEKLLSIAWNQHGRIFSLRHKDTS